MPISRKDLLKAGVAAAIASASMPLLESCKGTAEGGGPGDSGSASGGGAGGGAGGGGGSGGDAGTTDAGARDGGPSADAGQADAGSTDGGGSFIEVPVSPAGSGSLTVAWVLPTTNADGTALSPTPTAQRIKVALTSQFSGAYPFVYHLTDFTSTSKTITHLVSGTTYFMVHETYSNAQWSESSPEFSKEAA